MHLCSHCILNCTVQCYIAHTKINNAIVLFYIIRTWKDASSEEHPTYTPYYHMTKFNSGSAHPITHFNFLHVEEEHYDIIRDVIVKKAPTTHQEYVYAQNIIPVDGDGRCAYVCFLRMLKVVLFF